MNQSDFAKIINLIITSHIPILTEKRWLSIRLVVILSMLGYTIMGLGFIDWISGNSQPDITQWWKGKVETGRYNFFLIKQINLNATKFRDYSQVENIAIGIGTVLGLVHR